MKKEMTADSQLNIWSILIILVACFGLLGNIASIVYFGRWQHRKKNFFVLLLSLAIFDNIYLTGKLFESKAIENISLEFQLLVVKEISNGEHPDDCQFTEWSMQNMLHMFGVTGSVYFTLAICFERYLAICRPFFHYTRKISWKKYVIPVITLTVALNAIFILLKWFCKNQTYKYVMVTSLLAIPAIILILADALIVRALIKNKRMFCNVTTTNTGHITPSVSNISTNTTSVICIPSISANIDNNVCQESVECKRRKKNADLAVISLIIDVVFIVSHLINAISYLYNVLDPNWHSISNLLVVLSSSINFYVYIVKTRTNIFIEVYKCIITKCVKTTR